MEKQNGAIAVQGVSSLTFKNMDHITNISNKLEIFYDKGDLYDIVLVAGIDNFKANAHRLVLSASSDYFLAMFRSTLQETNAKEITLENIDGSTLKLILDFLYTSSINLDTNNVEGILTAADYFQIHVLVGVCCQFMVNNLDPSNCLGTAFFADQHSYTELYEKAITFAYSNFQQVCADDEFLKLDIDQLGRFLFSEDRCVISQENIFQSVIVWIENDRENREQFICSLLSHVRFDSLEPKFIVEQTKVLCKTTQAYEIVCRWLEWHLSPEKRLKSQTTSECVKPNCVLNKLAFVNGTEHFQVQTFDSKLNKWSYEEWAGPAGNRTDYSTIAINGNLIIVGGKIRGRNTNSIECLNLETLTWTQMPSMKRARSWPALAEMNGHLYVVGGHSGGTWTNSVEIFDFYFQTWTYGQQMRSPIVNVQVTVLNELLFAVGNDMVYLEYYNPKTYKWGTTSRKIGNSVNFGFATVNNFLYVVGGECNGTKCGTVEKYNPLNNAWEEVTPLPLGRLYVRCAVLNNRLIACVGYDDRGEWVNLVDEYQPMTNEWETLAPLLAHDFSMSSSLLLL